MNYFLDTEEIGNLYFIKLNLLYKLFDKIKRLKLFSRVDWICKRKNKIFNCELKVRTSLEYPTIFIEVGKYDYLMKEYKELNRIPLYINFCKDLCLIFSLKKNKPIRKIKIQIYDKAYSKFKWVERYELNTSDAIKLKLNE